MGAMDFNQYESVKNAYDLGMGKDVNEWPSLYADPLSKQIEFKRGSIIELNLFRDCKDAVVPAAQVCHGDCPLHSYHCHAL